MKTIEFFKRRGYNPAYETIGGEVMLNGICVGQWNGYLDNISFKGGDDSEHYSSRHFKSLDDCAKWIVESDRFDHNYEEWSGAFHYYFDTKTGYNHIANYLRTFPLIERYTITIEVKAIIK